MYKRQTRKEKIDKRIQLNNKKNSRAGKEIIYARREDHKNEKQEQTKYNKNIHLENKEGMGGVKNHSEGQEHSLNGTKRNT